MRKNNRRVFKNIIAGSIIILFATGCTKWFGKSNEKDIVIVIKQQEGQPLARVGEINLTVEELSKDFLERQGQFRGAPNLNTEKARVDYIENQVLQEAMFQEALSLKYFDRADVKRDVKKIVVQKLMRDKLEQARTDFQPTDEEIQEHYNKNKNLYNRDEAVRVVYIKVPFAHDKNKIQEMVTNLQKDASTSIKNANIKEFVQLGMKHATKFSSKGQISIETNETEYLDKKAFEDKFGPNYFDVIKNMPKIGQIAPLVTTKDAFVIMMKTGTRKALNETLQDAKTKIIKRLAFENRGNIYNNFVETLKKKYEIKIFREYIAELSKDTNQESIASKDDKHEHGEHSHDHDEEKH
jgi:hypothetical protein